MTFQNRPIRATNLARGYVCRSAQHCCDIRKYNFLLFQKHSNQSKETDRSTQLQFVSIMPKTESSRVSPLQDRGSEFRLRQTSQVTQVPNSYPAKLMYYLDCVCTVLKLDDDPIMNRLRQYHRCDLTTQQIDTLLSLCYTFGPDLLNKKCFFNNDELCGTSGEYSYYSTVIYQFILHVQRNMQKSLSYSFCSVFI